MTQPSPSTDPAAYMVIVGERVLWDRLRAYRKALDDADLYRRFGGQFLVARAPAVVLEGDYAEDRLTLIVRFPSRDTALGFWNSEYQQILPLRAGGGEFAIGVWDELPDTSAPHPGAPSAVMVVVARHTQPGYRAYLREMRSAKLLDYAHAAPLLGGPPAVILEGEFPSDRNTVAIRFPSLTAVQSFWSSAEYASVKVLRTNAADLSVAVWERKTL